MILRHCERSRDFSENPQLTNNGKSKSLNLINKVQSLQMDSLLQVVHSPKIRCCQTVEHLIKELKVPHQKLEVLDERNSIESFLQFQKRVQEFILLAPSLSQNLVVCSHHDWISVFFESLKELSSESSLEERMVPAGGYFVFSVDHGLWSLQKEGVL